MPPKKFLLVRLAVIVKVLVSILLTPYIINTSSFSFLFFSPPKRITTPPLSTDRFGLPVFLAATVNGFDDARRWRFDDVSFLVEIFLETGKATFRDFVFMIQKIHMKKTSTFHFYKWCQLNGESFRVEKFTIP